MHDMSEFRSWKQRLWLAALVASSIVLSLWLACAMPFAAFCALAACSLSRRHAIYFTASVWLANQAVGFAFLNYPWTANGLAWGAAMGLASLVTTFAAYQTVAHSNIRWLPLQGVLAFSTAFTVNELLLFAISFVLGGTENFTFAIQARILTINAIAFAGLLALSKVGALLGVLQPRPASMPTTHPA
ncbi:MAG: hypothetical protein KatS3mg105_1750 [Gemmatales bacterium]|nr:MAG: hypothetical protein KatS3mg105_1750 [Gemmatales bacterium]